MGDLYKVFLPDEDAMNWLIYNVPTVTVPELAPLGGSIVELFPAIRQDTPANGWDEQRKEKIAALAVRALSRQHPIEIAVKRVLSPKEFQDDMHLYQGAIYGLSPNADLSAQFAHNSLIRGLFQAGQTTYPGFGVSSASMSGIFAAESLMKNEEV
jgi:phytoene desaturase